MDDQNTELSGQQRLRNDPRSNQHNPSAPTTGLRHRENDTSKSTRCSGQQNAATRHNIRREERVTVQGLVNKQQPDEMSRRGVPPSPPSRLFKPCLAVSGTPRWPLMSVASLRLKPARALLWGKKPVVVWSDLGPGRPMVPQRCCPLQVPKAVSKVSSMASTTSSSSSPTFGERSVGSTGAVGISPHPKRRPLPLTGNNLDGLVWQGRLGRLLRSLGRQTGVWGAVLGPESRATAIRRVRICTSVAGPGGALRGSARGPRPPPGLVCLCRQATTACAAVARWVMGGQW